MLIRFKRASLHRRFTLTNGFFGFFFRFLLFLSAFDPTPVYVPLGASRCLSPGQRGPSRALPESVGGGGVVGPKGTAVSVRSRINTARSAGNGGVYLGRNARLVFVRVTRVNLNRV